MRRSQLVVVVHKCLQAQHKVQVSRVHSIKIRLKTLSNCTTKERYFIRKEFKMSRDYTVA